MKNLYKISGVILLIFVIHACKKDKPAPPIITTAAITSIMSTAAVSGGNIIADNGVSEFKRSMLGHSNKSNNNK